MDPQSQESPYKTTIYTLEIGKGKTIYNLHKGCLSQSPKLSALCQSAQWNAGSTIKLPAMNEDVGHSLVHYLYTGTYQTLRSQDVGSKATMTEYGRNVQLLGAARDYDLSGLEVLTKGNIENLGRDLSIFDKLDAVGDNCSNLVNDANWFTDYLTAEIRNAFVADETLFESLKFSTFFSKDHSFSQWLFRVTVQIFNSKIERLIKTPKCVAISNTSDECVDGVSRKQVDFGANLCGEASSDNTFSEIAQSELIPTIQYSAEEDILQGSKATAVEAAVELTETAVETSRFAINPDIAHKSAFDSTPNFSLETEQSAKPPDEEETRINCLKPKKHRKYRNHITATCRKCQASSSQRAPEHTDETIAKDEEGYNVVEHVKEIVESKG
ncbi:MAG: hypothetical protein M1825_004135 [Sarcosagium campestre]|nr:MAG: hypothetical protein M1825_004135 [Sarcosagium campestre]